MHPVAANGIHTAGTLCRKQCSQPMHCPDDHSNQHTKASHLHTNIFSALLTDRSWVLKGQNKPSRTGTRPCNDLSSGTLCLLQKMPVIIYSANTVMSHSHSHKYVHEVVRIQPVIKLSWYPGVCIVIPLLRNPEYINDGTCECQHLQTADDSTHLPS